MKYDSLTYSDKKKQNHFPKHCNLKIGMMNDIQNVNIKDIQL